MTIAFKANSQFYASKWSTLPKVVIMTLTPWQKVFGLVLTSSEQIITCQDFLVDKVFFFFKVCHKMLSVSSRQVPNKFPKSSQHCFGGFLLNLLDGFFSERSKLSKGQ
jgi:hypothetical protein